MDTTIEQLEEARLEYKKKSILSIFIAIGIIAFSLVFCLLKDIPQLVVVGAVLSIIIPCIITNKAKNIYKRLFKNYFVLRSLKKIFEDLEYLPDHGISPQTIASTEMMTTGDRFTSEDYVKGTYKGIKFEQSDVHIEEEHESTDSDGNTTTYYVTIFMGRWMIFDFNKSFKANLEVCQKGFAGARAGNLFCKHKYNKVKMESDVFNKKFRTYAVDDHEAFYILTPALMERLLNLVNSTKGTFLFCFVDNKLHIGLNNNRDSFEPKSPFKQIDEEKILSEVQGDINLITKFVEDLNLDNDLFKKEA